MASQTVGMRLVLEARVNEQGRPETLRQVARDLVKEEARAALEAAARNGQQPQHGSKN
jgi:hypothetical protein